MNNSQALQMMKSDSKKSNCNIVRYFSRHGLGSSFSAEVRLALIDLYYIQDGIHDEIKEVILQNPYLEFVPLFRKFLADGTTTEKQRTLECFESWIESGLVSSKELHKFSIECSASDSPWVRFLALVQIVRYFDGSAQEWEKAASAIIAADHGDWWSSIRPQALELLSAIEVGEVNNKLEKQGAEQLC